MNSPTFDLHWRLPLYREYLFYARTCRNFREIIRFRRQGGNLRRLDLRNGLTLELAGDPGFALVVFREIWQSKAYLRHFKGPAPRIVVDIGAHLGFFAGQAATQWPQCHVRAYEPDPVNFKTLTTNMIRNALTNVTVNNHAVWGHPGTVPLNVKTQAESHSIYDTMKGGTTQEVIIVPASTLPEIIDQLKGKTIDFLKIDCEGCEFQLIDTAPDLLKTYVRYLVIEYHEWLGYSVQDALVKPLRRVGFEVRTESESNGQNGLLKAQNSDRPKYC